MNNTQMIVSGISLLFIALTFAAFVYYLRVALWRRSIHAAFIAGALFAAGALSGFFFGFMVLLALKSK